MKTIQYKCELLSDIILNVKAATEGNQRTLDFIPGSCFLGILANQIDDFSDKTVEMLFSGKVRFGDGHIASVIDNKLERCIQIPASMMYQKMYDLSAGCYLHHFYQREKDHNGNDGRPMQLKQSRSGFYAFAEGKALKAEMKKNFAIKSAYDRELRRAKDEQMFGYESLERGSVFLFEVECDDESLCDIIRNKLRGKHRIGRSRTAQYGLAEITEHPFHQPSSHTDGFQIDGKRYITIYADGRLIFFDENGMNTFCPSVKDFGIEGTICWEKSQIRTFQYAPFNYKRKTRDADLCGIEKGSVIVVETNSSVPTEKNYIGSYNNEGFGRVIFNPDFLAISEKATNGEAKYAFINEGNPEKNKQGKAPFTSDTILLKYLNHRKLNEESSLYIYEEVNKFTNNYAVKFQNDVFASQWGSIRSIAMRCKNVEELRRELFDKTRTIIHEPTRTDNMRYEKVVNAAYLNHGIAMEKWDESRVKLLKQFIDEIAKHRNEFKRDISIEAVVNLASQMAKKCKK